MGKGRFNPQGATCSSVRECGDFQVTDPEYAISPLPKEEETKNKTHEG